MAKLKGIVVGAGRAGEILNLRPLKRAGADIVALCDISKELGVAVAKRNKIPHYFKTLEEATQKLKADFACIATPQQTHYAIAKFALNNDLHVLIEKPFTETIKEALELQKLAERKGKKIVVVHNHKFLPGMQEAYKLYKQGKIGKVLHINRTWMISGHTDRMIQNKDFWAHKLVGGKWAEVLPHALYSPLMFVDNLKLLDASVMNTHNKWPHLSCEQAMISLKSDEAYVNIFLSANIDKKKEPMNDMVIYGTKGVIFANYATARLVEGSSEAQKFLDSGSKGIQMVKKIAKNKISNKETCGDGSGHFEQARQFLGFLKGKMKNPVPTREAIETMRLSDEISLAIENECKKLKKKK